MSLGEDRQFSELNPWMFLHENGAVEVCKDSSLLVAFEITGLDADSSTENDVLAALEGLDTSYKQLSPYPATIQWIVHRRRVRLYPDAKFSDPISKRIDDNRRKEFTSGRNFVNRHYLAIKLDPATGASKFAERLQFYVNEGFSVPMAAGKAVMTLFSDNLAFSYEKVELDNQCRRIHGMAEAFSQNISNFGFKMLTGAELHGFFRRCSNPLSLQESVNITPQGAYFDDDKIPDVYVEEANGMLRFSNMGELYATGFSLKDLPSVSTQGSLDSILSMPYEITLSHTFRFASREEQEKHCKAVRRFNKFAAYPPQAYILGAFKGGDVSASNANPARLEAAEEANDALGEISVNRAFYGWHNLSLFVYGDTEDATEVAAKDIASILRFNGFSPIEEKLHLLSAYTATIPGMTADVKRWHFMEIQNLSDLTPFLTVTSGDMENKYLTEQRRIHSPALAVLQTSYGTPFFMNFHYQDLGHTFVVGPSGSGKSVGMNFFISQWQKYQPAQTYIFDKDRSCMIPTILQGGAHIDLTSFDKGDIKMNPMLMLKNPDNLQWCANFIESLILSRSNSDRLSSEDSKAVWEAVTGVAARAEDDSMLRLMSVYSLLPLHLQDEMQQWIEGGRLGHFFDNEEDSFSLGNFTCIEIGEIMSTPIVARPFMDYAFYRIKSQIEKNRTGARTPTLIYIEECWFMLDDPHFSEKVRDWIKTLRKLMAIVVMATQSPEDLAQSDIFSTLRDGIPTRIFLPNRNATSQSLHSLYANQFELNDSQIEDIASATPKRDYLITQPGRSRMVRMSLDKDSLACLRSDSMAINLFQKHRATGHPNWKQNYIEELARS